MKSWFWVSTQLIKFNLLFLVNINSHTKQLSWLSFPRSAVKPCAVVQFFQTVTFLLLLIALMELPAELSFSALTSSQTPMNPTKEESLMAVLTTECTLNGIHPSFVMTLPSFVCQQQQLWISSSSQLHCQAVLNSTQTFLEKTESFPDGEFSVTRSELLRMFWDSFSTTLSATLPAPSASLESFNPQTSASLVQMDVEVRRRRRNFNFFLNLWNF